MRPGTLETPLASRNFRSFWYHEREDFPAFAELVRQTWPGMDIERPELNNWSRTLCMFCKERRITRELYWVGHGFQIWCQILAHLVRSQDASLVVIDEPEIYLHPDLQRVLVYYLRELGPSVVMATHSSEIVAEAESSEIVLIEKARRSGLRLREARGVQVALDSIGSVHNVALTQLARTRRVLFVENYSDSKLLRGFAGKLGLGELAAGQGITVVPCEGFSSWQRVKNFGWGMKQTVGAAVMVGVILDRDFYCCEEIEEIRQQLAADCSLVHILARKEIENYLLVPGAIERAIRRLRRTRGLVGREPVEGEVRALLDDISTKMKADVVAQLVGKRIDFHSRAGRREDRATATKTVIVDVDSRWLDLGARLPLVPGKEVLAELREVIQRRFSVTLTDAVLLQSLYKSDLPDDIIRLLEELERFRGHRPPAA